MSNLGNAYVLVTSIYARDKSLPIEDIADSIYHCVDVLGFGSDEAKADLYAQLAENLVADMTFEQAVEVTHQAMDNTSRRYHLV